MGIMERGFTTILLLLPLFSLYGLLSKSTFFLTEEPPTTTLFESALNLHQLK